MKANKEVTTDDELRSGNKVEKKTALKSAIFFDGVTPINLPDHRRSDNLHREWWDDFRRIRRRFEMFTNTADRQSTVRSCGFSSRPVIFFSSSDETEFCLGFHRSEAWRGTRCRQLVLLAIRADQRTAVDVQFQPLNL